MKHSLFQTLRKTFSVILALTIAVGAAGLVFPAAAADQYEVKLSREDLPRFVGNFIQPWLYNSWDDARWEQEMQSWKQVGMEYVIMGDTANYNKQKKWEVQYKSKLDFLSGSDASIEPESLNKLFYYCEKYDIKVILGIGLNVNWYDYDLTSDAGAEGLRKWRTDTLPIMDELYQLYKTKYPETFYGWYWVEELYNDVKWNDDTLRTKYADVMSGIFNIVIDKINALDSKMPLFFSPHVNPNETGPFSGFSCTDINKVADFWSQFISKTNFRPDDTLIPQASLDHAAVHIENLEKWTKVYADGIAASNKPIRFWSNLESFHGNDTDVVDINMADHAYCKPLGLFKEGLDIVSKYCDVIFTFAYSHFYSPYVTVPGYYQSYLYYLEHGEVEKNPPVGPNRIKTEAMGEKLRLIWGGQWDDFGIGRTNIYKNGKLIDYVATNIGNGVPMVAKSSWIDSDFNVNYSAAVYEIEVIDVSGNVGPKVSFAVSPENANNGVELEPKTTAVFDPANPIPQAGAQPPAASLEPITGNTLFTLDSDTFKNVLLQCVSGSETAPAAAITTAYKEERGLIERVYRDEAKTDLMYEWVFSRNNLSVTDTDFTMRLSFDFDQKGTLRDALQGGDKELASFAVTGERKGASPTLSLPVKAADGTKVYVYRGNGEKVTKDELTIEVKDGKIILPVSRTGNYLLATGGANWLLIAVIGCIAAVMLAAGGIITAVLFKRKRRTDPTKG